MPYKTTKELPDGVQHVLPAHAQNVYKEAFNSAYDQYDNPKKRRGNEDREQVAHKVAWGAVKRAGYQRRDDDKWHKS